MVLPACIKFSVGRPALVKILANNVNGERGLVCQFVGVCLEELPNVFYDLKDGVSVTKGY